MKKLFVLVSCFAVLLVLSNVSFAQEGVAAEGAPCVCCSCPAVAPALSFAYPPYPAQKTFGGRLATLTSRCALAPKAPVCPQQVLPFPAPPQAYTGCPYGTPALNPRAVRRAVRLAPQPYAFLPPGVAVAPPVAPPVPILAPAPVPQFPVAQMGDSNRVFQRVGGAPVINFLSIVRAPRDPYAGYYYRTPIYGYPQPAVPAQ